ncbi:hypothetical protein BDF20DRAFT_907336 [Mycotypha africana]|uniref:uncharacterized protein n=1 Tax=Mycotypha africana TaxID=64632 RepID=UPI0023013FF9|nr:uncharacterized protein BDF20DRAFT_907336 [Mycotypha africana]KAI8971669.1 hypothetical protein BDF20DRAFT_907336 [Mycotypha africana]
MHRLIGAALILDKMKVVLVETYRSTSTLLVLEHFVSLAIVSMGICSRLFKLCHLWVNQIEECYYMLYEWSACFPSGFKNKEWKAFTAVHNLVCTKDMLKEARMSFAQDMLKSKSSIQHKVHLETYIANQAVMDKVRMLQKELNLKQNSEIVERF